MILERIGHGQYFASNGYDTVAATFLRGRKVNNPVKPRWRLLINNAEIREIEADWESTQQIIEQILTGPRTAPMSEAEMQNQIEAEKTGEFVHGIVSVSLSEIINYDKEEFLDLISTRLIGCDLLNGITYGIVGFKGANIHLYVHGSISLVDF